MIKMRYKLLNWLPLLVSCVFGTSISAMERDAETVEKGQDPQLIQDLVDKYTWILNSRTELRVPNGNGDHEVIAICKVLSDNKTLRELNISNAQIGNVGATAMANLLKNNSTLKILALSFNNIGDEGCINIFNALHSNYTLQTLYLDHNKIGAAGAAAIAMLFKNKSTIRELYLHENTIETLGGQYIVNAIENNCSLVKLHLEKEREEPWNLVLPILKRNKKIANIMPAILIILAGNLDQGSIVFSSPREIILLILGSLMAIENSTASPCQG